MRVEIDTLEDFVDELSHDKDNVHERIVRCRIVHVPKGSDEVFYDVGLQATAIVKKSDGDYLLDLAMRLGEERHGHEKTDGPCVEASKLRDALRKSVLGLGLELRPGKWEVY